MDVDFVVMWVDGSDPDWLREKQRFDLKTVDDRNSTNRFRDNGLMKYWFRAVEQFAPWVRKIHFVTWGHLPSFLNCSNPKLHIVRHEDYMPIEALPTFNANALEMNLHRIEGLAEHFVYFNDDMFLLKPTPIENYFSAKGQPCCHYTEIPTIFTGNTAVWQILVANDVGIINKYFNKRNSQNKNFHKYFNYRYHWYDNIRSLALRVLFPNMYTGFKNDHAPAPFVKDTFLTIWEKEPNLLMNTSLHKFRDYRDVNQWLPLWWQIAEGAFSPRRVNAAVLAADDERVDHICSIIRKQQYEMVCINDPPNVINFELVTEKIQDAFECLLPNKSSFEI